MWVQYRAVLCEYSRRQTRFLPSGVLQFLLDEGLYTWSIRKTKTKPINSKHKMKQIRMYVAHRIQLSLSFLSEMRTVIPKFAGLL